MPALTNPRHERFAQELAKGSAQIDAYVAAGYERSEGAASRLSRNVKIAARVKELIEKGAERAEISIAALNERLIRLANKAENIGDASGIQASRACVADIAKLNGMIVDRAEVDGNLSVQFPRRVEFVAPEADARPD